MSETKQNLTPQDMLPGVRLEDIPAFFDRKFLARILCISEGAAYDVMCQPRFPVWRITSHIHRIYKVEFLDWVEEQHAQMRKG